jgi:hypothetical protein
MWPREFERRLEAWNNLRSQVQNIPIESALAEINAWWFDSPWVPYYLHWDDQPRWPDPWQLLSENIYCDVARGLGILYTITLLDRADTADAALVLTADDHNLVQVAKEKYILNWERHSIVNTNQDISIKRRFTQHQAFQHYN